MATIGLDKPFYAKITEDAEGVETYGTPQRMAKAISANMTIEYAEGNLPADDAVSEAVRYFKSGSLSLGIDDLLAGVAADILGVTVDKNGVVVASAEDVPPPVAVGFRALRSNGKYEYFWLYRVQFGVPGNALATKGDSIQFNTPTLEGTIMRRNKPNAKGAHPWRVHVTEGADGVSDAAISGWFEQVYEPDYTA